ncbi:Sarcoplasmic calcium-binding protein [Mytilus edulis]|uniref:Blast:Sarcoplasmic calcium-binding protein n=2 Tax=Mytilus TaxID=6548 RepID=A0A8B6F6H0_MYTGA|nr:Sarcoplasmic calcium-binding protein [Mytilus edulis]VDI45457.1 blast:Sarcoplasmic calcium-binding protein [Mytilus galloprovincialis]
MDYLKRKWTLWYKSLDVNHDGSVSFDDAQECQRKFLEMNQLTSEKTEQVRADVEKWWTTFILPSKDATVTLEIFLERLEDEYKSDREAFVQKMNTCFSTIFNVFDTNADREISVDEQIMYFKAFGQDNEKPFRQAFVLMEPKNDTIPLQQVVNAWVQFTTCDDETKKDVIKESFE